MSKIFFIDSENVGDTWTLLLDAVDKQDELFVFYTQKSPHMSYKNLIRLKNSPKDVTFIECFEGSNALDFQLVTELGYRLGKGDIYNEYFIVSNDNGFEAVVKYWRRLGMPIRRFTGKACASISSLIKEADGTAAPAESESANTVPEENNAVNEKSDTEVEVCEEPAAQEIPSQEEVPADDTAAVSDEPSPECDVPEACTSSPAPAQENSADESASPEVSSESESAGEETQSVDVPAPVKEDLIETILNTKPEVITVDDTSRSVLYCIGKDNLANLHEALMQLYGNDKCKVLYNIFKSDSAYRKVPAEYKKMSPEDRQQMYCNIVYGMAGFSGTLPEDFAQVVMKSWRNKKNLNSLRASLERRFGKENGKQSYALIKAHIKILDNIS